jgi:radical SAM protein with 4Fe4S-binding SPASM domain
MRQSFAEAGADFWCVKPLMPFGEAARHPDLWLKDTDINKVIEFCYNANCEPGIPVIPSATFEMHTKKGAAIMKALYGENTHTDFTGCHAGIFSAQLQADGNLLGVCMCSPKNTVGNVTERPLKDIWEDSNSFKSLREFDADRLEGYCGSCDRRKSCKGGDLSVRLSFGDGSINSENKFCAYRNFKLYGLTI